MKNFLIITIDFLMFYIIMMPKKIYKFNPMVLSIMLLIYSILLILKLTMITNMYMYIYIIFILMIGGIMIIILYLTSISNNELISLNFNYLMIMFQMILFMMIFFSYMKWYNYFEMLNYNYNNELNFNLFNFKNMLNKPEMLIFMLIYLFIMMITSLLICLKNNYPLRQMNLYEKYL